MHPKPYVKYRYNARTVTTSQPERIHTVGLINATLLPPSLPEGLHPLSLAEGLPGSSS